MSETCCTSLAGNAEPKISPKLRHLGTIVQLCRTISSPIRLGIHGQSEKNLLNSNTSSNTCPDNTVNFGPLAAEICWPVWGAPVNFNWFRVLAALLHVTLVVGVSQTLRRWTEGDTYIRQNGHLVGRWPTFLVLSSFLWPPYGIGQAIIFSSGAFFMAALRSRCGHYIFAYMVSSSIFFFFPRLISAVGDWMSAILPHITWP